MSKIKSSLSLALVLILFLAFTGSISGANIQDLPQSYSPYWEDIQSYVKDNNLIGIPVPSERSDELKELLLKNKDWHIKFKEQKLYEYNNSSLFIIIWRNLLLDLSNNALYFLSLFALWALTVLVALSSRISIYELTVFVLIPLVFAFISVFVTFTMVLVTTFAYFLPIYWTYFKKGSDPFNFSPQI